MVKKKQRKQSRNEPKLIACLGWGSLVWDPRDLPIRGKWFCDGPFLPVEFARQSSRGRITLVIVPATFPLVRILWAPMSVANLDEARLALGSRECGRKDNPRECVDYWPGGSKNRIAVKRIGDWARTLKVDAVVWTNLPPEFNKAKRVPDVDEVVKDLDSRDGHERENAEEYVRKAPRQVATKYRRIIEAKLGWTPIGEI